MEAPCGASIVGISGGGNLSSQLRAEARSEVSWAAGALTFGIFRPLRAVLRETHRDQ